MSSSPLALARSALRAIHPIWAAVPVILLVAWAGSSSIRSQVNQSERIEDRLTGIAMLDALRLYAEATPPGAPTRPADLHELVDDARRQPHQTWLDGASADELGDPSRWELLHDSDGRLRGARRREAVQYAGLTRWFVGEPAKTAPELVYAVPPDAPPIAKDPLAVPVDGFRAAAAAEPERPAAETGRTAPNPQAATVRPRPRAVAAGLPQPMMPDTPLPGLDLVSGPLGGPVGGPGALDARLASGFAARQVLRLSALDDMVTVRPRRLGPGPAAPPADAGSDRFALLGAPAPGLGTATAKGPGPGPGSATAAAPTAAQTYAASQPAAPGQGVAPAQATPPPLMAKAPATPYSGPAITVMAPTAAEGPRNAGAARADRTAGTGGGAPIDIVDLNGSTLISNLGDASVVAHGGAGAPSDLTLLLPRGGDTYEEAQDTPAGEDGCRTLIKDRVQCDVLQGSDPDLYQRCNQSMSDRIAACIAGLPLPALITR